MKKNNYELMTIKWIDMTDEMKKRIGEVLIVAPWRVLNLFSEFIGDEGAIRISDSLKFTTVIIFRTYIKRR